MSDNPIKSWIKERRRIHDAATEGPWGYDGCGEIGQHWSRPEPWRNVVSTEVSCMAYCYGGSAAGVANDEDATAIVDAHNMFPRALTALEQVLKVHSPGDVFTWAEDCADPENHHLFTDVRTGDMLCEDEPVGRFCDGCVPKNDTMIDIDEYPWPCATVQAIEGAISNE